MIVTEREAVLEAASCTSRSLEQYLRALWWLGRAESDRASVPPEMFFWMLTRAITAPVAPFDNAWRTADLGITPGMSGFELWERVILSQIADRHDFAEVPDFLLADFGMEAPRNGVRATGLVWYNHTVCDYLDCALAGTFDGTRPKSLSWNEMTGFLICGQEYE
ncbi:hypothetical protein Lesp02_12570 [Lentzea sp. NBRC 105346]|uniref:hypothetical protein n=1 Tax=Lentzea sp. NBRC 105346 TaxID=3032205 RepID=UPI0024A050DA|nr:hypothetical protein [Lentzea sp. NBRC 105346]GLZ29067.1 hypothetical protein Lesp02_12570 [Lentzea sp. NBRC 105346]